MSDASKEQAVSSDDQQLVRAYESIRAFTERICEPLSAEDCAIQSMPDVSPARWHLAHTTWFFETFVLAAQPDYREFDPEFAYLFNSYYNTVGRQFPRIQRGLISRPSLETVRAYRRYVDEHMLDMLRTGAGLADDLLGIIDVGLNHEQQHQELMFTDIKHVLSINPQHPVYREGGVGHGEVPAQRWIAYNEGIHWIGHEGADFAYDNETPRHRVFLESFELSNRLVTCGDYIEFIEADGYQRPEHWLSLGWQQVCERGWQAPFYWLEREGRWWLFTLAGLREIDPEEPVCHVNYFEADAFARWAGARLPTEAEWEIACASLPAEGNFANVLLTRDAAVHPARSPATSIEPAQAYGDVWEWTASPYVPYPGYAPPAGALGEYNGKFMCNQYVLRGGSCATPSGHVRATYRNFFPPDARWQFSGIRLCRPS